jgi:C4-dicarboxylate-specific signal transduction histidine kinase
LWRGRLAEQSIVFEIDDRSRRVVNVVASELQQVALNFLVNAEYAVLHSGRSDRRVVVRTRDTGAGWVRMEVEDSGDGVSPEDEAKLFQPFFTTKPVGDGTGLGLSVSYGIVHSYGGTIGYERGAMGGARFYFELPAVER